MVLSALVGELVDAAVILIIVGFCAALGFVQEYRAERALEALKKMLASTVTVIRKGLTADLAATEIVPGDILVLGAGDKLAADIRLIESHSIHCDEATLTGDSVPVGKADTVLPEDTALHDITNMAFTGTTIIFGRGRCVVVDEADEVVAGAEVEVTAPGQQTVKILIGRYAVLTAGRGAV